MASCLGRSAESPITLQTLKKTMIAGYKCFALCSLLHRFAFLSIFFCQRAQAFSFGESFHPYWGEQNVKILDGGQIVELSLDQVSGCGFVSKNKYLFGYFSAQLKLVPGNSAGVLTSLYLSSRVGRRDMHDEVDFEFLGNVSGQPYILQTNVYTGGVGGREQRVYLWFDPTAAYHWYSIMWNPEEIVFWVDAIPIRSFKNNSDIGVPFPSMRPMALYSSMFDASNWATRGGLVGIDWTQAPFVTSYTGFTIMGCKVTDDGVPMNITDPILGGEYQPCELTWTSKWWSGNSIDGGPSTHLDRQQPEENSLIHWVRDKIMIYDYCKDSNRYPIQPAECQRNEQ